MLTTSSSTWSSWTNLLVFVSHFTRVTLCDPRGVSIISLTNPPLEHRTIFSRASTESQATKPSRRWQPPKVTSTTSLQHEQCHSMQPLNAIALEHSLAIDSQSSKHKWVRGFLNQAHTRTTHAQGALTQPSPSSTSIYSPKPNRAIGALIA